MNFISAGLFLVGTLYRRYVSPFTHPYRTVLFEMTKEGEGSTTDEGNYNMYSVLGIIRYIILL